MHVVAVRHEALKERALVLCGGVGRGDDGGRQLLRVAHQYAVRGAEEEGDESRGLNGLARYTRSLRPHTLVA